MSRLPNPKHELYVQARAEGESRKAAYAQAGFKPHSSAAGRLERKPVVAARLAELRERDPDNVHPAAVIVRLLRLADTCAALNVVPAVREARLLLVEAVRLQSELSAAQAEEEDEAEDRWSIPPRMTNEQWILRYGLPESKEEVMRGEWRDRYDQHGWRADDPAATEIQRDF